MNKLHQPIRNIEQVQSRITEINRIIQVIAVHGRHFLYSRRHDRISRFSLTGDLSRLIFVDCYSNKPIKFDTHNWEHFSQVIAMEKMKLLVLRMAEYIHGGPPIEHHWFGLEGESGTDSWGYGKDAMDALHARLTQFNAIENAKASMSVPLSTT